VDITAEQVPPVAFQIIIIFAVFPKIRFSQGASFLCCVFTVYAVKKPFVIPAESKFPALGAGLRNWFLLLIENKRK
jgi:hypothetical protein